MLKVSSYNSEKIANLNAISILLVLLIHSYFVEAANYPLAQAIQVFSGTNGISSVAVPLFFFISGLLFFKNVEGINDCLIGLKKRVRTLLVPYIIWNLVFVGWFILLHVIPGTSRFINSDILSHFSWENPFEGLRFLFFEPAAFQLWFLRDLMAYMLTTPILLYAIKRYPFFTLIAMIVFFGWIPRCGMAFFYLGAIIALHNGIEGFNQLLNNNVVIVCCCIFLCKCIMTIIPCCQALVSNPYIMQVAGFCGILSVWGLYDRVIASKSSSRSSIVLTTVSRYSFFIFLFHEPVFNIIKKLSLVGLGVSNVSLIICYFINPVIMVLLSIGIAFLIKTYQPKLYGVIVGGR